MLNNQDLSSKAMLVKLSISQWNPAKLDKIATAEVQNNHNAKAASGRYTKNRVPKEAIKPVQKAANAARTYHAEQTLQWSDAGFRILPAANFDKYTAGMRERRDEFENAVRYFIDQYPAYIDMARYELGTLFDDKDYPSDTAIFREFNFDTRIQPLPMAEDFRVSLRDADRESIQAQIAADFQTAIEEANRGLWERLFTATKHMADKLSETDAVFRDSLVSNLCDLCQLLPDLNLTGDTRLEDMRREVQDRLCNYQPQQLRENKTERAAAATEADAIAELMAGYMGGSQ